MLVDTLLNTHVHFMDGISGYNQIKVDLFDAERTAVRAPICKFYTVTSFDLKNVGATYQHPMIAVCH